MSGTRAILTTSRREMSSIFFPLQGKAPEEIHAILTETLACFLPGRAKDLYQHPYTILAGLYSVKGEGFHDWGTDFVEWEQYFKMTVCSNTDFIGCILFCSFLKNMWHN